MSADGCDPPTEHRPLPASDFDLLPYPSLPFAYSQPSHMAAMASLFGLDAPPPDHARVLELGCASGGNIIPLAVRFPACRFVGIDLSERQVGDGRTQIAALGLSNIELLHGDLGEVHLAGQEFDYVICHGVFSWVPRTVQDAILRICREVLAPNGIAAISYNVLPGWHLRSIVRDICLGSIGDARSPRERVARARGALERIARSASEREPYGQVLRSEAKRLARLPDAYILGEFLVAGNEPVSFSEFAARARDHALAYVCEGDLAASCSELLFAEAQAYLSAAGGADRIAAEQAKDFLTGRPFRRSLLAKARPSGIPAQPDPDRLRRLHFSAHLTMDSGHADETATYRDGKGRTVRAKDPAVGRALACLADAYPSTLSFEQLAGASGSDAESRVCKALYAMAAAGQVTVAALPLKVGRPTAERPCVWPLARLQAGARPWLTTLQHDAVASSGMAAFLCPLLDGATDRQSLRARVAGAMRHGDLVLPGNVGGQAVGERTLDAAAAAVLDQALTDLARSALLEP